MKCPKCGYISFDYNQVCPKCNKDITGEQERLNIPAFKPEPPYLLAALIGDANETQTDMQDSGAYDVDDGHEADLSFDDSGSFDSGEVSFDDSGSFDSDEISFDDSQELELDFETQEAGEFGSPGESEGIQEESVSDFDFDSATDDEEMSLDLGEPEKDLDTDLDLDLDSFSDAEPEADENAFPGMDAEEEDISLGVDDLSLDMDDLTGDEPESGGEAFLDTAPEEEDISLGVDDLSLDDAGSSGEMEVFEIEEESNEPDIDLEDVSFESDESSEEDLDLGLDDLSLEKHEPEADADDIDLMSSGEISLDLAATSLEGDLSSGSDFSVDDSETIDLDDLDLEIDLEDSEQQKST